MRDLLRFSGKADGGLLEAEERPGLGLEAVPVEAGQRDVGALQLHRAAQHRACGQRGRTGSRGYYPL